jgi:nucleotide-binding universal stress UspA family protein
MMKLLVAVDGSDPARRAVDAAAKLARATGGAEVLLLNVRDSPIYYGELPPFDAESVERGQAAAQQALLDDALAHARRCGLENVRPLAAEGLAAQEISRLALEHGVDQIVMGTRGRNLLGGLLLGSVAQRVVHLAAMPVLLVK